MDGFLRASIKECVPAFVIGRISGSRNDDVVGPAEKSDDYRSKALLACRVPDIQEKAHIFRKAQLKTNSGSPGSGCACEKGLFSSLGAKSTGTKTIGEVISFDAGTNAY